jgi:hypothetical protein
MNSESTIGSFISMMENFIDELAITFPTENKIKVYKNSFDMLKKTNPRKVLDVFLENVSPYSNQIVNKDESIMLDDTIPLNKELNLKSIWVSPSITENTKEAIWAHLNTLLMFGTTIQSIPSGLMKGIEQLAQQYSGEMSENTLDPSMLLSGMQSMMKNLK